MHLEVDRIQIKSNYTTKLYLVGGKVLGDIVYTKEQKRSICGIKRGHKTKAKANKIVRKSRLRLYVYQCPLCGDYHVTRQKQIKEI